MTSSQRVGDQNEWGGTFYSSVAEDSDDETPGPIPANSPQIGPADEPHPTSIDLPVRQDEERVVIHRTDEGDIASHNDKRIEPSVTLLDKNNDPQSEYVARQGGRAGGFRHRRWMPTVGGMDWFTPGSMISLFFVGLFFSLGHHFYHTSLIGVIVGDNWQQLWIRGLSNFFAYVVQLAFLGSIGIAYTQTLWMALRERAVTTGCLDAAFAARSSWFFIFKREMFRELTLGALIAVVLWCLPIPLSIIPPATLITSSTNVTSPVMQAVQSLGISDPGFSHFFELSRPANGPQSTNTQSQMFLGPRTILSRLLVATAATGEMLPIFPPAVNCTYEVAFHGPMVQCETANQTVSAIIDEAIAQTMQPVNNITQFYNAYYAYVPDLSGLGNPANSVSREKYPLQSSNELWLAFKRNGTDYTSSPYPKCPVTEHRVCRLYNASYELGFTFVDGQQQSISGYPPKILEPIEYPVLNLTGVSDTVQFAYSAFFWSFTNLLVGSMGFYNESFTNTSAQAQYSDIGSSIENTALLGSSDLDCFFAFDTIFDPNPYAPISPQRAKDIQLARNEPLDELIPELAFNTTISLMNDPLLGPSVNKTVTVTNSVDTYDYHSRNLLLCYGLVTLVALIANCFGGYAFRRNGASHDWSFWSIFSATDQTGLHQDFHSRRGSLPIPKALTQWKLKLKRLDEEGGGWGFRWVETFDDEK